MESTATPIEVIGFNWYISKIHVAEQNVLNLNDSQVLQGMPVARFQGDGSTAP